MKKPLIVRPEAEGDMDDAYLWYEDRVPGLGSDFLLCVDAVIASIERNPQIYPVVHRDIVRRALTRRFPYEIFFVEGESKISVIAVFHARRNPQVWKDRV